jgi:flap endonuclease-1
MGIKNLIQLLNKKCSVAIHERNLDSYRGMIFGIDLSIYLYKFLYRNGDHIVGLMKMIMRLLKNQILPVFVFDGSPPEEKYHILKERKKRKLNLVSRKRKLEIIHEVLMKSLSIQEYEQEVMEKCRENSIEWEEEETHILRYYNKSIKEIEQEIQKISNKIIYIRDYHIESSKQLFDLVGVPYVEAPCEAESYIAYMCKKKYVDGCISEDTDVLVNGVSLFLRHFSPEKNTVMEYCLKGILDTLEIRYDEFVDMCILSGSDYTLKIQGVDSLSAHEYILKYRTIENCLKHLRNVPNPFDYVRARHLFKNPLYGIDISHHNFQFKIEKPQIKELVEFISKNSKMKTKYIQKHLMNYYFDMNLIQS